MEAAEKRRADEVQRRVAQQAQGCCFTTCYCGHFLGYLFLLVKFFSESVASFGRRLQTT